MEYHPVKIKSIEKITPDVLRIITSKPSAYTFTPGQATEIAISKDGWEEERRPFSFTSLPVNSYLEFTIKTYPDRDGVTNALLQLKSNDVLILHEVFGAITYAGQGLFIAGGAGITPFISIFRNLHAKGQIGGNKLIFANKTKQDIILKEEFENMLGTSFINILSAEKTEEYHQGMIDTHFLETNITGTDKHFYLCGPPPMVDGVHLLLSKLGISDSAITVEELETVAK